MNWRHPCQELEPLAALAEPVAAMIGAVPLPFEAKGTAHNRLFVEMVPVRLKVGRPVYAGGNLGPTPSPGTTKAGPATVGAVVGPWIATSGLTPDASTVWWNIAALARCYHRPGSIPTHGLTPCRNTSLRQPALAH